VSEDTIFKAPPVVAVVGATGHTAHFVINELLRRKMSPVAIARNSETLAKARFSGDVIRRHARHSRGCAHPIPLGSLQRLDLNAR